MPPKNKLNMFQDARSYKRQILKWSLIGLALRLGLMPFAMHGQDLLFINYFPMMFVKEGIWDPYGFISRNFSHFPVTYYGPVLFLAMAVSNFVFVKLLNAASLIKMLEVSATMMGRHFVTYDYVNAFLNLNLFRNLFLMKSPYLIFDFLTGAILLRLAMSRKVAVSSYILWMLNIVILHSVYAVGQADIVTIFFIIMAVYTAIIKRPYLSVTCLSLGGATKLFPYVLILPSCLLLASGWKRRILLILAAVGASAVLYFPFWLSSGKAVLGFFVSPEAGGVHYAGTIRWVFLVVFISLYSLICINAVKDSTAQNPQYKLLYYFAVIMFLSYTVAPIRFRYFAYITPLLALLIPHNRKFGIFILLIVSLLAFLWLTERDLQLGMFAPINPGYFSNLPTIQEVLARFVNINVCYKISARVLPLTFFIAAGWVWRIKI